jgi:hypothetical protein
MVIIVVVITGLMWLLGVRRDTEINLKDGTVKTSDSTVARAAATSVKPNFTRSMTMPNNRYIYAGGGILYACSWSR